MACIVKVVASDVAGKRGRRNRIAAWLADEDA